MNQVKMTEEQIALLSEATNSIEDLCNLINKYIPSRDTDNAATRFEEGYSWLQKVIVTGTFKEIIEETVPNVLDA